MKKIDKVILPVKYEDGWYLPCKKCNHEVKVGSDSVLAVTCWKCVNKLVPFEDTLSKSFFKIKDDKIKKPAGWHFMSEFVDSEGNVYHNGIEKPELKGKLQPTIIIEKKRLKKKEKNKIKQDLLKQIYDLKKQYMELKFKKDKKKIEQQINKIQKKINKL